MNFGDRPGEWLGYAPGESPHRLTGGPNSPKKKTMNWRVARDLQLSKEQEEESGGDASKQVPGVSKATPSMSLPPPAPVELDTSVGSDEEEVIEEVVVDEDGPVFDVVEYDDDDDDGSEYEEEVLEDSDDSSRRGSAGGDDGKNNDGGSDRSDDESMFDPLPPPIEIPNALKPVHMRQTEQESTRLSNKREDSSSEDDSTDSDDEKEQKNAVSSLRPGTLRGHSNDGLENMEAQVRRGKRPDASDKKVEEGVENIKEAPRVAGGSVRPNVVRGHSCEDDIQAMNEAVRASRGGKRPEKNPVEKDDEEEDREVDTSKADAASPPVSPLRPGTVRGHSFDRDIEGMSKAARGGKKPDNNEAKVEEGRVESPTTPSQSSKPSYHSLRNDGPSQDPKTPTAAKAPATPTQPKTPTRATATPTTHKSPSRRGEDTAPAAPSYTRVDDNGVEHKEYSWEKPAWATKSPLKSTAKGNKLKEGSDIARPIGGIKPVP